MFNRRNLFEVTAALGSVAAALTGRKAAATIPKEVDLQPRGQTGRLERLPRLDLESQQDFLTGFRAWVNRDLESSARKHVDRVLKAKGLDPRAEFKLDDALALLKDDPLVATRFRTWTSCQQLTWQALREEFHANADAYLAEMEAVDQAGPGTLELNPDMKLPDYTTHEIHIQPGGYVGDPFAGHVYHYGTNNFYVDRNYQDEVHLGIANAIPTPPGDGKVKRILDMGCSCGQLSVALKQRFPEAEVWGIDVGGPMVRYAHMRAVDLGVDVNFAQRLAEDTKFPDNHFDIVTSYILHHEVTEDATRRIIEEAHRVLRPGGVFYPVDFFTHDERHPSKRAYDLVRWWWTHRWNREVWYYDYARSDYVGHMRKVGFDTTEEGPPSGPAYKHNILGIKRA
jgi:SAM-dependent methyltransferase